MIRSTVEAGVGRCKALGREERWARPAGPSDPNRDLYQVLGSIRAARVEVATSTVAASRAKARAAARVLAKLGDNPADLVGLAHAHAAEQEVPASLAWGAVADLLAPAERG